MGSDMLLGLFLAIFNQPERIEVVVTSRFFSRNNNYQAASWNEKLLFSVIFCEQQLPEEEKIAFSGKPVFFFLSVIIF
jgi:hypothetical protein